MWLSCVPSISLHTLTETGQWDMLLVSLLSGSLLTVRRIFFLPSFLWLDSPLRLCCPLLQHTNSAQLTINQQVSDLRLALQRTHFHPELCIICKSRVGPMPGVIGVCQSSFTHAHTQMNALHIWAFRESECVWQTVNQPMMKGNSTMDRSISYFLRRQTEEKYCYSPGKWFTFRCSFISLIALVSVFSFCFFLTTILPPRVSPALPLHAEFGCSSLLISSHASLIGREVEIQPLIRAE